MASKRASTANFACTSAPASAYVCATTNKREKQDSTEATKRYGTAADLDLNYVSYHFRDIKADLANNQLK